MQQWAYAKVVEIFGADLRSLATFRIVLALLALSDLANRATDLSAHYTDAGIMPRTVLVEQVLSPWAFSIHLMNGGRLFQALLFGVAALAAFGMLVGYRTRLMTFVVWALLLSIQLRNPLLNGSESPMLRMLFFWGMLLPLGAYWSVDRARSALPRPSPRFLSLATFGLFMQIAFVYWFTAALKAGPEWRSDYTALYYALSLDQLATPIGHLLLDFPSLLQALTLSTVVLEAIGPLLLFCPFFTGPVRTGAALAFMGFHLGIWLTMDIGIFPWISAFCMVCFFPTWFWDRASTLRSVLLRRVELARRLQLATARLGDALVAFSKAVVSFLMEARQLLFAVPPLAAGAIGTPETRHDECPLRRPRTGGAAILARCEPARLLLHLLHSLLEPDHGHLVHVARAHRSPRTLPRSRPVLGHVRPFPEQRRWLVRDPGRTARRREGGPHAYHPRRLRDAPRLLRETARHPRHLQERALA